MAETKHADVVWLGWANKHSRWGWDGGACTGRQSAVLGSYNHRIFAHCNSLIPVPVF